jgi:hypothetical protein
VKTKGDPMIAKNEFSNLEFVGVTKSKRQDYFIYKSRNYYLILSFKNDSPSGNFNLVDTKAIEYVYNNFRGEKAITSKKLLTASRKKVHKKYIPGRFDALNILYILCAMRKAKIDKRYKQREIKFNIS